MEIKTYPLQFTGDKLREIEKTAGRGNIKRYIYQAIEDKLELDRIVNKNKES